MLTFKSKFKGECTMCHKTFPIGLVVGGKTYCRRCGKKVQPILALMSVSDGSCECGSEGTGFEVYDNLGFHNFYCLDCLTMKLQEMLPLPDED